VFAVDFFFFGTNLRNFFSILNVLDHLSCYNKMSQTSKQENYIFHISGDCEKVGSGKSKFRPLTDLVSGKGPLPGS
jgi:hypothetical protein